MTQKYLFLINKYYKKITALFPQISKSMSYPPCGGAYCGAACFGGGPYFCGDFPPFFSPLCPPFFSLFCNPFLPPLCSPLPFPPF